MADTINQEGALGEWTPQRKEKKEPSQAKRAGPQPFAQIGRSFVYRGGYNVREGK